MDVSARSLQRSAKWSRACSTRACIRTRKRYLGTFDNHFSTIGLVGMNEACLNAALAAR